MSDLSERRPVNTDYAVSLLEQLKFFYEQKLLTDVVLLVEDTEFPCHKMVLATCSSYFRWVRPAVVSPVLRLFFLWPRFVVLNFSPTVSINNAPYSVGLLCWKTAIIPLGLIVTRCSYAVIMQRSCYVCKCSPPTITMNNAPRRRASVTHSIRGGWKTRGWCFLESRSSAPIIPSLIYFWVE